MNDKVLFFSRCTDANLVEFVSGAIENVVEEKGGISNVDFDLACVYGARSAIYYLESGGLEYIADHYTAAEVSLLAEAFDYLNMEMASWLLQRFLRESPDAFDAEDRLEVGRSPFVACEELSSHLPAVLSSLNSESKLANFIRLRPTSFFKLDLDLAMEVYLPIGFGTANPGFLSTIFRSCERYAKNNSGRLPSLAQLKKDCVGVTDDRIRLIDPQDYLFMNDGEDLFLTSPPSDYIRYVKSIGGRFYFMQTDGGLISKLANPV